MFGLRRGKDYPGRICRFDAVVTSLFWGVVVVDLELFKNWGFHIDTTPLMYLKTPKEAMASTPLWLNLCLTLLMLGCVVLSFWVFRRYVLKGLRYKRGNYWGIPIFLLIGGAMILPVRGGVNLAPLNSSAVFYHAENMYANQAAVNAVWNFIYELMHMKNLDKNIIICRNRRWHKW